MQERLCDTQLEDCRAPLLTLIQNETQGLDVAFWYMADARYSNLIVQKFQAGLPVRVLMDDRADESKPSTTPIVKQLKDAGIPMRKKSGGGILHWKMMLFHGQNVVEFSKANYYDLAFAASSDRLGRRGHLLHDRRSPDKHVPHQVRQSVDRHDELRRLREHHQSAGAQVSDLPAGFVSEPSAGTGLREPRGGTI